MDIDLRKNTFKKDFSELGNNAFFRKAMEKPKNTIL